MSVLSFPSTEPVGGFASCTCCALTYIIVKIHIVSILFQVSVPKMKHKPTRQQKKVAKGYSSPEPDVQDSSGSEAQSVKPSTRRKKGIDLGDIQSSIESIKQTQEEIKRNIMALRNHLLSSTPATDYFLQQKDYFVIFLLILLQVIINFIFK